MLQGVLPIYSINIKIQRTDLHITLLITTLSLYLVNRGFVITCLAHRRPTGRGSVLPKVFPVRMISVYVAHMIDIFSNIYRQRICNTTPIGFCGWVEVLIKINWNWLWCCKLAQLGGKFFRPATSKFLNCNDFGLPIIISTGMKYSRRLVIMFVYAPCLNN